MHNLRKGQQLQHPKAQHTKKETAFKTDSADQSSYTTQIAMLLLCRDKKSNLKKVELCQIRALSFVSTPRIFMQENWVAKDRKPLKEIMQILLD